MSSPPQESLEPPTKRRKLVEQDDDAEVSFVEDSSSIDSDGFPKRLYTDKYLDMDSLMRDEEMIQLKAHIDSLPSDIRGINFGPWYGSQKALGETASQIVELLGFKYFAVR